LILSFNLSIYMRMESCTEFILYFKVLYNASPKVTYKQAISVSCDPGGASKVFNNV
jgi:hypothetical protein